MGSEHLGFTLTPHYSCSTLEPLLTDLFRHDLQLQEQISMEFTMKEHKVLVLTIGPGVPMAILQAIMKDGCKLEFSATEHGLEFLVMDNCYENARQRVWEELPKTLVLATVQDHHIITAKVHTTTSCKPL